MAVIEFWGGLGVIGSSKILISDGGHRVLLDIGLDIPSAGDLFRPPARERPGRELADRLRVGGAPKLPGLYAPEHLDPGDPLGEWVADTAVFVSHPHIDHVGLAGFVREDIPVYAHRDAVRVLDQLAASGAGLLGGDPEWRALDDGQIVEVGDMRVECVLSDHDVPGASAYLVHTASGVLAFTGDIRFHGRHPERARRFVERAAGCDVLVTEGTTLSWDERDGPARDEQAVLADLETELRRADLVAMSVYPRDVERIEEFQALGRRLGRRFVWPSSTAAFLRGMGVEAIALGDAGGTLQEIRERPGAFVVCYDPADLPALLDLPFGPSSVFVHANGEPLGEFDPRWGPFKSWLDTLGLPLCRIGASGHASQVDLHGMVEDIAPRVVFPIHSASPTRLIPPRAIRRVIARYGTRYDFNGEVVA